MITDYSKIKEHEKQFARLYELYTDYNAHTNISSIKDKDDVYLKHFADSLSSYDLVKNAKTVIDIGTGGGFPAIPLAIVLPKVQVTAVDSVGKKIKFIELVKKELQLDNLIPLCSRAEELSRHKEHREAYDICTSRAVSELNSLLEYSLPFVKIAGLFIAYKKFPITEEIAKSHRAVKALGAEASENILYASDRQLLIYKKISFCSQKYPREQAQIKKSPL